MKVPGLSEDVIVKVTLTAPDAVAGPTQGEPWLWGCHRRWYGPRFSCKQTWGRSPLESGRGAGRRQHPRASGLQSLRSPGSFLGMRRGTVPEPRPPPEASALFLGWRHILAVSVPRKSQGEHVSPRRPWVGH